jgi:uncharacterized protein (DUF885 family)
MLVHRKKPEPTGEHTRAETNPVTKLILTSLACLWIASTAIADDPNAKPKNDPAASMALDPDLGSLGPPPGLMAGVIERYEADRGSIFRSSPRADAKARGQLAKRFNENWLKAIESLDFEGMGLDDRVDYTLLKNRLRNDLRQVGIDAKHRAEVEPLMPFAPIIQELDASRRRMERPDGKDIAGKLTTLAKEVGEAQKALDEGKKPSKVVANRGVRVVGGLRNSLREFNTFHSGYDPIYTWWTTEPYKEADKALEKYETFLRERVVGLKPDDKTTIIGDPIGREALLADLDAAMIPYTPEQLIAIAEQEFAWCDAEMLRASRDLGYGDDWKKALEKVKNLHVEPGKQPEMIKGLALEAIEFVEKNDLLTLPPLAKDSWRMEMMTPERQLVNPFFLGGEVISVSFPTSGMTHEQKLMSMRGNNVHFSRATVHHELIPGHHLQMFMMDRYRPYRQKVFETPFWIEGWALYWEMVLWDKGFPKTAEDRVGFLFWRMHRCARIIFSLKFHLGQLTPQQCIDFLVDRVGHERENATAEVRRSFNGGYGPLYQCAYMLGAMQLRALRKELVDTKKLSDRAFHDAILRENAIPIEMVRAILTREKLPRDFTTSWKFAGEVKAKE